MHASSKERTVWTVDRGTAGTSPSEERKLVETDTKEKKRRLSIRKGEREWGGVSLLERGSFCS